MAHSKRLIAVFLAFMFAYTPYGWAAYATAPTPSGFGGSPGAWKVAAQTGDTTFQNLLKKAPFIPKDYGGTVAKLGSGFRYGTAARAVAAGIISMHPALRVAAGVAMWLGIAKLIYNSSTGQWEQGIEEVGFPPDGGVYTTNYAPGTFYSKAEACDAVLIKSRAAVASGCIGRTAVLTKCGDDRMIDILHQGGVGPYGTCSDTGYSYSWTRASDGCPGGASPPCSTDTTRYEPITPEQAAAKLQTIPMPPSVPLELPPGTELPIEGEPVNNPGPGTNMTPQTVRVPVGDPVPQPDGTYKQPYVDIVPSPTPDQPWRVDVKPGDKTTTDGSPLPEPTPVKPTDPDPDPTAPPTYDPNDPTTKVRDPALQDLCEKHPGIAACAPYEKPPEPKDPIDPCVEHPDTLGCMPPGELTAEQVPNEDKQITLAPDGVWGPAGVCPQPRVVTLAGGFQLSIPFTALCSFAEMIRPLVIAMAYLGAALMVVGVGRKD